jgi:predicted RNase H-like nuclease (RuvC/YqgF family)
MDQTVINATTEFLNTQISALQESIEKKDALILSIQERSSELSQNVYKAQGETQMMRDNMQDWTMTAFQNEQISEEIAEEIAEICGFDLNKEVEVEVTVTYNLTLQVPHNEDVESMVNDIDFESVSYNSDNITWLSASVDRVDF